MKDHDEKAAEKEKQRPKQTVAPTAKAPAVFEFLEAQHWGDERNSVDRIVLCAAHGKIGMRLGPAIREWSFAPKEKPGREKLIEMANTILALAEADCDALGRPTRYVVLAYDMARSDRAIGRVLIKLHPSGTTTALADERGGVGEDEEEGGGFSTKLLLTLLEGERRDKRWTMELAMNAISGAMERDADRIERMESIVDGTWQKQAALVAAIETQLSAAADREQKAQWQRWKQEKINLAVEKGLALAQTMLPGLMRGVLPTSSPTANPIRDFMESVTSEQGLLAFGRVDDSSNRVVGGLFDDAQFQLFMQLAHADTIDDAKVAALASSLRPDQITRAQEIFRMEQLAPLVAWIGTRSRAPGSNGVQS